MKTNLLPLVRQAALFRSFTDSEFKEILPALELRECNPDEILFREQSPGNEIFIVICGEVICTVKGESGDVVVAHFKAGDIFGEIAFFDMQVRSATCTSLTHSQVIVFDRKSFEKFMATCPHAAARLHLTILEIITDRLDHSDTFLAEMVAWGDQARKRSITDEETGLFNRRYLDQALNDKIFDAKTNKTIFTVSMLDIDHFGDLNKRHGKEACDKAIILLSEVLLEVYRDKKNIIARYGGDEFFILLPDRSCEQSERYTREMYDLMPRRIRATGTISFTISQGIAECPRDINNRDELINIADTALYQAKKLGRNQWHVYNRDRDASQSVADNKQVVFLPPENRTKGPLDSLVVKNRIINNIIDAFIQYKSFIIFGHRYPDEDCIGSAVALALFLKKILRTVTLVFELPTRKPILFLKKICDYNHIPVIDPAKFRQRQAEALIACDTAKPDILDIHPVLQSMLSNPDILTIELDHHLGSDSRYIGNRGYCLVDEATSTAELVFNMLLKFNKNTALRNTIGVGELINRTVALSILIGMLSDTKNGQYFPNPHFQHRYASQLNALNAVLRRGTYNRHNFFSSDQIIEAFGDQLIGSNNITKLSAVERRIHTYMLKHVKQYTHLRAIILNHDQSHDLAQLCDAHIIRQCMRITVESLLDTPDSIAVVGYFEHTDMTQLELKMRRAQGFATVDLREILRIVHITDGGGHPGAVGFRIPDISEQLFDTRARQLVADIDSAIGAVLGTHDERTTS